MLEKNPLDELFKDIKRQIREEEALEARRPQPPKPPRVSPYANPDNWTLGSVVTLIHITDGKIGDYQEYFFRGKKDTRRLLPANPLAPSTRSELVFGDHWLHPHYSAQVEFESFSAEERAIVARFNELIEDLEEDF